jgi:Domain of unknown function (DUF6531)
MLLRMSLLTSLPRVDPPVPIPAFLIFSHANYLHGGIVLAILAASASAFGVCPAVVVCCAARACRRDCSSKYSAAGVYPADPTCPLKASAVDFGGMGGYVCGDPVQIASYCSGPSAGATVDPISPDDTLVQDGDGVDGNPDSAGSCGGADAGCGSSTSGGDPVRLNTGQFHLVAHDLHVADTISLDLARVYRSSAYDTSGRPMAGAFGVGATFNYDSYLMVAAADANGARQLVELYLPSGIRVPFTLRAGTRTIWDNLTSPGDYYRATLTSSGSTQLLTLRDGRTRQFTMIASI